MVSLVAQGFPSGASGKKKKQTKKNQACQCRRHKNAISGFDPWVQSLGQEDPLEEDMATHSSILA